VEQRHGLHPVHARTRRDVLNTLIKERVRYARMSSAYCEDATEWLVEQEPVSDGEMRTGNGPAYSERPRGKKS